MQGRDPAVVECPVRWLIPINNKQEKKAALPIKKMSQVMRFEIPAYAGMTTLVKGDDKEPVTDEPAHNPAPNIHTSSKRRS